MSVKVEFITPEKESVVLEGKVGQKVRDLAVENKIPGIPGDCGGTCSCGTCHVHVDPKWMDLVGTAEEDGVEDGLLFAFENRQDNSRLSCQIFLTEEMDGLKVEVVGQDL